LEFFGFAHQGAEEAAKRVAFVGEDAGNVFPEAGGLGLAALCSNMVNCIEQLHIFDGEGAAGVGQAFAHAGHAEGLAGRATDQHLWRLDLAGQHHGCQAGHVAVIRRIGVVVSQHGAGEWLNLGVPGRLPPDRLPGDGRSFNAAADTSVGYGHW
jgi:hypothetical protein